MEVCETITGTLLVCDWNLRAWTFLEAFRGRENIYILCKENVTVPLKNTFDIVRRQGSIEIASLMLCRPHVLPSDAKRLYRGRSSDDPFAKDFLSIGTAGTLLSFREASRPGDDIAIWSLLLNDKVYQNAKAFWKSRQGDILGTSFLVSSDPRLKKRGLGWAPSSPTAPLVEMQSNAP